MTDAAQMEFIGGREEVEAALTDSNPVNRVRARCATSAWCQQAANWTQDELRRGDGDAVEIMRTFFETAVSLVANVAIQAGRSTEKTDDMLLKLLHRSLEEHYRHSATCIRSLLQQEAAQ